MTLFLDGLCSSQTCLNHIPPSAVFIQFPVIKDGIDNKFVDTMYGILSNEPHISTRVKWGPILNDLSNLQDVASLLGAEKMWTWIGAGTMCWKGTEPIKTDVEFYLINYKRGLNLEGQLTNLNMLTALVEAGPASVHVHGGYFSKVLENNNKLFNNGVEKKKQTADKLALYSSLGAGADEALSDGTVSINFGNKLYLRQMLVERLDVSASIVEVPDGKPLYYRVSMGLTGARPLLSTIVDGIYGG